MNVMPRPQRTLNAFTVVELIVVIAVVAILVAVVAIGYGQWRKQAIVATVKSDLTGLQSAMGQQRNWYNSYPVLVAGAQIDGSGATHFFQGSAGTVLTYYGGNASAYCVNAVHAQVQFYIDTRSGSALINEGQCSGSFTTPPAAPGNPATPSGFNPPIPGTSWNLDQLLTICSSPANAPSGYTVHTPGSTGTYSASAGHDIIYRPTAVGSTDGSGGNDILCMGAVTGPTDGGAGNDIIVVMSGAGTVGGSGGDDVFVSRNSHTGSLDGSAGSDIFIVRTNTGSIDGGAGVDTLQTDGPFTGSASSIETYL